MEIKNARFQSTVDNLIEEDVIGRLLEKDPSLWKDDTETQEKIVNRLGWLDLPESMSAQVKKVNQFVASARKQGFRYAVLLGMGGSSLCPEVCRRTFGTKRGFLRLLVLDTTDPSAIRDVERTIDLKKTLFIVSSKSGGTIEMQSLFRYFYDKVAEKQKARAGRHFVAITDPKTPLEKIARRKKFRQIFTTQADVGGRYSALTFFGLVPAALMGIDIKTLLKRAEDFLSNNSTSDESSENEWLLLGAALGVLGRAGRDKVTFIMSPEIASFGLWSEQLIAESTGKEDRGLIPIEGEEIAPVATYSSNDRFFVYLRLKDTRDKTLDAKVRRLETAGHPVARIDLQDRYDLGQEFIRWEAAVSVAGMILEINPFDEPNVSESKANTNKILAQYETLHHLPEDTPMIEQKGFKVWADQELSDVDTLAGSINTHLARVKKGDYVAIMAYLNPDASHQKALQRFRHKIRDAVGAAVTIGYGPRFLHSTGQLHKGGENNGVFIQITVADRKEIAIPESNYGFATLKMSQALGDFQCLKEHSRRSIRYHVSPRAATDLDKLTRLIKKRTTKSKK